MNATRIMVYSHDAFGLGNLRRMLAICEHLLSSWPKLSILLVSGSPMIHEFRLPKGLDYIKLPCLNRGVSGELAAKYLGTSIHETVALRSQLIRSAAVHFKPNLLLVDKKPTGLKGELTDTLKYLQQAIPNSKCVLLLRDILDTPEKTISEWCRWGYYQALQTHYDQVLVAGMQGVFDLVQEYRLPLPVAHKTRYCGYIRKSLSDRQRADPRVQLGIHPTEPLVLVTPGGGEDGYSLVHAYLKGLKQLQGCCDTSADQASSHKLSSHKLSFNQTSLRSAYPAGSSLRSLILCGPEMPTSQRLRLQKLAATCSGTIFQSFTRHLLSYVQAADVVVAMGGYNTLTEILTLGKRTVVVPRVNPSQEQLIRATRFTQQGWITMMHPEQMTGRSLMQIVLKQLSGPSVLPENLDFNGLPNISQHLSELLAPDQLQLSEGVPKPASRLPFICLLA